MDTIKTLQSEKKIITAEILVCEIKDRDLFWEYCNMEGKYATKVYDDTIDPHFRPYTFKYAEGMKEKEDAEREQFLLDNDYYSNKEKIAELKAKKNEIAEQIFTLQHGMTRQKYRLIQEIKETEKQIADTETLLPILKELLATKKRKLEECAE